LLLSELNRETLEVLDMALSERVTAGCHALQILPSGFDFRPWLVLLSHIDNELIFVRELIIRLVMMLV
jgi:hypothetical protein